MSQGTDIPVVLVFLAIAAEFFGSIALVFGFLTRVAACGIAAMMLVALALVHTRAGLFMNWASQAEKTEGFEYHLLVLGICIALILRGGGAWSIDRFLVKNTAEQKTRIPLQS
jgi:putative oxidoreductase